MPMMTEPSGPTGVLFSLVAAIAFLQTGGASRVVAALSRQHVSIHGLFTQAVSDLLAGVQIAIALAVPFVVALVFFEITAALVARAVTPANLQSLWAPLRTVFILLFLAIALERVSAAIALVAARPF